MSKTSTKITAVGGLVAATAGLAVLLGSGIANAAPTGPMALPAKGGSPHYLESLTCDQLKTTADWIALRITIQGGDASQVGSTAWLQQEEASAKAAGKTVRADRLQTRIDRRAAHPDRLSARLTKVQAVEKSKGC